MEEPSAGCADRCARVTRRGLWGQLRFGWILLSLSAVAQTPSFHLDTVHGRKAYVLENGKIRVSALRGGGHLAEIRFKTGDPKRDINPMRVPHYPTIEPYEYQPRRHDAVYGSDSSRWLMSGYMGHLLCFPTFGASSPEEARNNVGDHGEAPIVEWKQQKVETGPDAVKLWYAADLPATQFRVERAITLPADESVVYVEEWIENLAAFDRPINWVQHATFGPPFIVPGRNFLDAPAGKGQVFDWETARSSLRPGTPIEWPEGMSVSGQHVKLREFQPLAHKGTYYALLLDRGRQKSYFTLYTSGFPTLIGYLFPTADDPWLGDWQENQSATERPWDGKVIARGLEFGTSPMPEGLRKSVERGTMFGVPTYRWIAGRQRLKTSFVVFLAEIGPNFAGVADVRVERGRILIEERKTGKLIALKSARAW